MKSFQSRVLDKLEAEVAKFGLETSIQSDWGNTGTVLIHQPGSITPAALIRYDFQSSSYKLTITVGGRRVPSQFGRYDYFDFYHGDLQATTRFWPCLYEELAALPRRVK